MNLDPKILQQAALATFARREMTAAHFDLPIRLLTVKEKNHENT